MDKKQKIKESPVFGVSGPHKLPVKKGPGGRRLDIEKIKTKFCDETEQSGDAGCYVFAIRRGKGGIMPWYVGKTVTTFRQEAFSGDKEKKYNNVLVDVGSGTPVIFFLSYEKTKGPLNKKWIDLLERYLIQESKIRNPLLINKRGTTNLKIRIQGVVNSPRGKRSNDAAQFSHALRG